MLTFAPDLFSLSVDPTLNKPVLRVLSPSLACIRLSICQSVCLPVSVCLSECLSPSVVGLFKYHFSVCFVCPCVSLRLSVGLIRYHFSVCSVCPCVSLRLSVGLFQYHFSVCSVCLSVSPQSRSNQRLFGKIKCHFNWDIFPLNSRYYNYLNAILNEQ